MQHDNYLNYLIGKHVRIIHMHGEPQYSGKTGTIEFIDDIGQIHGTWGGCAIIPEEDMFIIYEEVTENGKRRKKSKV